jgi:DNA-directed RNA polymerase subunit L
MENWPRVSMMWTHKDQLFSINLPHFIAIIKLHLAVVLFFSHVYKGIHALLWKISTPMNMLALHPCLHIDKDTKIHICRYKGSHPCNTVKNMHTYIHTSITSMSPVRTMNKETWSKILVTTTDLKLKKNLNLKKISNSKLVTKVSQRQRS